MQALSDSTASSRRHSLDIHELMKSSSPAWPRQSLDAKDEDRESKSGEWIDKHEELIQDQNPISPEQSYQSMVPQQQSLYVTHITFYTLHIFLHLLIFTIFQMTEMVGNKISKCRVLQITNLMKPQQATARIPICCGD